MSLIDRLFGRKINMTTHDKLATLDSKIRDAQAAQKARDIKIEQMIKQRDDLSLLAVTGDAGAEKEVIAIDLEIASLRRLSAEGARVLAELGDDLLQLRQTRQAEIEAEAAQERANRAKEGMKKLPALMKRLSIGQVEIDAVAAEIASYGVPAGITHEATVREWLGALSRGTTPAEEQRLADHRAFEEARARRDAEARANRSAEAQRREEERLKANGWDVKKSPDLRWSQEERDWVKA